MHTRATPERSTTFEPSQGLGAFRTQARGASAQPTELASPATYGAGFAGGGVGGAAGVAGAGITPAASGKLPSNGGQFGTGRSGPG